MITGGGGERGWAGGKKLWTEKSLRKRSKFLARTWLDKGSKILKA